jgi:hypothetical protein
VNTPSTMLLQKFEAEARALYNQAAEQAAAADNLEAGLSQIADDTRYAEKQLAEAEAAVQRLRGEVAAGRERHQQDSQKALQHRQTAAAMRADAAYLAETIARARGGEPPALDQRPADVDDQSRPELPSGALDVAAARQRLDAQADDVAPAEQRDTCVYCEGAIVNRGGGWVHAVDAKSQCVPDADASPYATPANPPAPAGDDAPFRGDEAAE